MQNRTCYFLWFHKYSLNIYFCGFCCKVDLWNQIFIAVQRIKQQMWLKNHFQWIYVLNLKRFSLTKSVKIDPINIIERTFSASTEKRWSTLCSFKCFFILPFHRNHFIISIKVFFYHRSNGRCDGRGAGACPVLYKSPTLWGFSHVTPVIWNRTVIIQNHFKNSKIQNDQIYTINVTVNSIFYAHVT